MKQRKHLKFLRPIPVPSTYFQLYPQICQWSPPSWQTQRFHRPYLETALSQHSYLNGAISFFFFISACLFWDLSISSVSSYPPTDGALLLPHPQTTFLLWAWQEDLQVSKCIVSTLHRSSHNPTVLEPAYFLTSIRLVLLLPWSQYPISEVLDPLKVLCFSSLGMCSQ